MVALIVIVVIVVVLAVWVIVTRNNLVTRNTRIENAFAQIEVELQRRYDLIPNVIETVRGYMSHETETLERLTQARTHAMNAQTMGEKVNAGNEVSGALRSLFAVAENYPDLKSSQNFLELQRELSKTEDRLTYARQSFNDTVMKYNQLVLTFPSSIVANLFHFTKQASYEVDNLEARSVPEVRF